jgi:hypothetical protein
MIQQWHDFEHEYEYATFKEYVLLQSLPTLELMQE